MDRLGGAGGPAPRASAAGRLPGADFEELLGFLWQEHEQLRRECARLQEGRRSFQDRPAGEGLAQPPAAAPERPGPERPLADDAGRPADWAASSAPAVLQPSSEERSGTDGGTPGQASHGGRTGTGTGSSFWSPPISVLRSVQSTLSDDTGNSQANRKMVAEVIAKYRARGRTPVYFPFSGAKYVKQSLRWVRTGEFSFVFSVLIILNAVYVGAETTTAIQDIQGGEYSDSHHGALWLAGDIVFAVVFLIEIVLRIFAYQRKFFSGTPWRWNVFDCVICFATLVASMYDVFKFPSNFWINLSKVLRLARLVRTLRTSRSRHFHTLRTLTYTVAGSCNAFLSALLLLTVVMFVFGSLFMQGLSAYLLEPGIDPTMVESLKNDFGSVTTTTFTLLACVTGGRDWVDVSTMVAELGMDYQVFFCLYIIFTVLCVLNILNGVFVNAAIESATKVKELATETIHYNLVDLVKQLVRCWMEMDQDLAGKVSWEDVRELMGHDDVRQFLLARDIDVSSAREIFVLLDHDGTGELHPEDFVDHLISLQGNAKAIDMASLRVVCDEMSEKIYEMERTIHTNSHGLSWLTSQAGGGRDHGRERRLLPSPLRNNQTSSESPSRKIVL